MNFPYQIVSFFGEAPLSGSFVYQGDGGWYPHIAIKRRYAPTDGEELMLVKVKATAQKTKPFIIQLTQASKPARMPVEIIEVAPSADLNALHIELFKLLGQSKYPEREGEHYSPHMTISWEGKRVIDPSKFENTRQRLHTISVLIDGGDDSKVLATYLLSG